MLYLLFRNLSYLILLWWYSLSKKSITLVQALNNSYFNYCNVSSFFFFSKEMWSCLDCITSEHCSWLLLWRLHSCFMSYSCLPHPHFWGGLWPLSYPQGSKETSAPGSSQSFASPLPSHSVFEQAHLCSFLCCSWLIPEEKKHCAELPHYYYKMPSGSISVLGCLQETLSMIWQLISCQM